MPQGHSVSESVASIAYEARNKALQVERDIQAHEDLCSERYAGIHDKIREIKSLIGWAGGLGMSAILGLLGFLAVQTLHDRDSRADAQQARIEQLTQQVIEARTHNK